MDIPSDKKKEVAPLWLSPLVQNSVAETVECGSYSVIQKLLTRSPNPELADAEIETSLEAFLSPSGDCLWRRVAVRSGPTSPKPVVHASFSLPSDGPTCATDDSLVCWAAFPERPSHKLLFVLVHSTLINIWDVYPEDKEADLAGEGHSVTLPFEARAIFPLGERNGLLIQRMETPEDYYSSKNLLISSTGDDDGFFLKAPPKTVRLGEVSQSPAPLPMASPRQMAPASTAVPSLFSLSHHLNDVLPVSNLSSPEYPNALVTDVYEKILCVGTLRWTDHAETLLDKREYSQLVAVTYHTHRRRHAIWTLKGAPPPPPTQPLWQRSRQWRLDRDWSLQVGALDQDVEDMELLGVADPDMSHYNATTRDEALADALGVRKTPRKSEEAGTRGRGFRSRNLGGTQSLLSPSTRTGKDTSSSAMDIDLGVTHDESVKFAPLLSLGSFSSLHPSVALVCLYEEEHESDPALDHFLISNAEGSGLLVLGLLCPGTQNNDGNPNQLRLFSFEPSPEESQASTETSVEGGKHSFSVQRMASVACLSAQPVACTPIPPCFRPHLRHRARDYVPMATDLLLLRSTGYGKNQLSLYRSDRHIVDCDLQLETNAKVVDIVRIDFPISDRFDVVWAVGNEESSIRCQLTLLASTALSEKTLQTLDAALFSATVQSAEDKTIELALKFRADCARLGQAFRRAGKNTFLSLDDPSWSAITTVLLCLINNLVQSSDRKSGKQLFISSRSSQKTDWELLIESEFHQSFCQENIDSLLIGSDHCTPSSDTDTGTELLASIHSLALQLVSSKSTYRSVLPCIFDALHLLYEESKLMSSTNGSWLCSIGDILLRISDACRQSIPMVDVENLQAFTDHYRMDLPNQSWPEHDDFEGTTEETPGKSKFRISSFDKPPCFLSWVDQIIRGDVSNNFYNYTDGSITNAACDRTRSLRRIFSILFRSELADGGASGECVGHARDFAVVTALIEEGFDDPGSIRDGLPSGVALPLLEVLHRCRSDPSLGSMSDLSPKAYSLIGRLDLDKNSRVDAAGLRTQTPLSSDVSRQPVNKSSPVDKDKDGLVPLERDACMIFPNDNRMKEAARLLRSSRPSFLSVPRAIEVSDHDYERQKQNRLLVLCRRVLALPVGRGMLTIGSLRPVPAEPLPLPDICLAGRVAPTNATLALDVSDCPHDMKEWPEFHNGVAAGLRLPLDDGSESAISMITRTWIVYNRPLDNDGNQNSTPNPAPASGLSHAHGGLLMALGLRGHLTALEMTDLYDYLTQGTVTTTVGILLGMSANKRGTCDLSVSKMLCLHIPSLIPHHFSAIDVASPVQAAAVSGAGLLFQGSSHRMMTEFLLNEIGKRPSNDSSALEREAYTLSCGIALGMVNLCQGDKINCEGGGGAGLSDLRIEERLYRFIVGGVDGLEMRRQRESNDRLSLPSSVPSGETEKCSSVFEGDSINTDVTAPGATLALGLMYMKTQNSTIASAVAIPDTHFLLEYVRPDFLLLRVVAKSLILWDDVLPTKKWIEDQIPNCVRQAYGQLRAAANKATDMTGVQGSGIGESQEGGHMGSSIGDNGGEEKSGMEAERGGSTQTQTAFSQGQDYDRQAVRQIYAHVVAGACFSMGLRYAGTANKEAAEAIFDRVMELRNLFPALRPEPPVLEMCICCAAVSLAMVQAGTGDLDTLRLLKVLCWPCDEDVRYGTHMAYGEAIGLLFLGGGTCTLGREPEDIAALVAAFFPRYPSSMSDNQYHIQALRHLYAVAVKHRELRAVDVDTGESVFVPLEVHFRESDVECVHLTAPCLLCNTDSIPKEIRVVSERYFPVVLDLRQPIQGRTFYVKKRSAHLSYIQDPHANKSLLVQTGSFRGPAFLELIKSFTEDPSILAYARYLCDGTPGHEQMVGVFSFSELCMRALHKCLTSDTEEALPLYMALHSALAGIRAKCCSAVQSTWDFRLIQSYYEQRRRILKEPSISLLDNEMFSYLCHVVELALARGVSTENMGASSTGDATATVSVGCALTYADKPLTLEDRMDVG